MLFGTRICLSMNKQEQRNIFNKYKLTYYGHVKTDICVHMDKNIFISLPRVVKALLA